MTASAPRLTLTRKRDRQSHDPAVLREILAEGCVAHVGFVRDGLPIVLPFLYGIGDLGDGPTMLLHGSTGAGAMRDAADGLVVSATVTHLDGIVFADSTFDSSANYRSAMVFGRAVPVPDERRDEALWQISDHLMPGRRAEVREMTRREVRATQVLALPLDRASVKVRFAGTGGTAADGWTGVLPLAVRAGAPIAEADAAGPVAASVSALADALDTRAAARRARLAALIAGA
ncbi:pyridoxamine 5'-phosphate oxidase family protein [Microbacterium sp. No. 7]|uniref:pyridoxamine 5'-phosphate oxidase family protein n=1 Tax=Microbacterium sp. No. 7 TaxID=1714373 RepID=UPI0006D07A83|nr:pyridoxamine 5'-phosphate oxidase family protein [Microbacterium sp. No. 7]ALJ21810.1 flavin-nucleotide-binding protein [Microbacterium sp. No. 7]